ncbi:MAG: adenylosuccinate lyase [Desulfurococcales archaeon ex4484_58]|nr:MAG: adenylosuccinate lyase [Desulfurococcales archaeon ex4484_58]
MNQICPLEYRYSSNELRSILSRKNLLNKMVIIEKTLLKTLARHRLIPMECLEEIDRVDVEIKPEEITVLEERYGHEVMALTKVLADKLGVCGRYVHLGFTSNDVIDTSWALIIRESLELLMDKLVVLINKLTQLTRKYRDLIMIGRTHGQHALPVTLGFKFANYLYELTRSYERLRHVYNNIVKCKVSGAVGTLAAWRDKGLDIQESICRELGLEPYLITTQIAPRDGYAELLSILGIIGSQLDRLALEIRELARPEINELVVEPPMISSSTMPHKKNPVRAERVSGLARVLRGFVVSGLENIVLMHERDLSNSSFERIVLPHSLLILDQILEDTLWILDHLKVNTEAIMGNIELSKKTFASECIMVKLVTEKNMDRFEAHRLLSKLVDETLGSNKSFREVLLDSVVSKLLSIEEIDECLDPGNYLGSYNKIIDRVLGYVEKTIGG